MSYNRNRNNNQGGGRWSNNMGNNMGGMNPWDSGSSLNAGANVLNALAGNTPDAVQQLLAASKILSNVLGPQQSLMPTPQAPPMYNQGGYGGNRGNMGNNDRYNRGGQRVDSWGSSSNRRNDSGNYNRNRGNQNQNQRNKSVSSSSSQKKDTKVVKKEDPKDDAASAKDGDSKENRYADIPKALLYCHVCRKYMWDDVSFDNHIKGRNHKLMLEELDKLYKMQCEIMRQEFRMNEQQHGWYYDKAQRMGKKVKKPMEYCTMCDLNFHGTRGFHRKSTKHQELKHFLHPKCNVCNLEFPTRLEWDEHILMPNHLKKMAVRRAELKPNLKEDDFDFDDFLYVSDLSDYLASDLKAPTSILTDVTPLETEKDEEEKEEEKEDVEGEDKKDDKKKVEKLDESTIEFHFEDDGATDKYLDEIRTLSEDDYAKKAFIRYNATIPSGTMFVVQSEGHLCRICNLFVGPREDAVKHCKGYAHHISLVNVLAKVNQARKTVRKRSYKDGKDEDVEMKDTTGGEEGNWKRRKVVAKEDANATNGDKATMEVDEEEEEEEEDNVNGGGDDEEDEVAEEAGEEAVAQEEEEEPEPEPEPEPVKPAPKTPVRGTPRAKRGRGIRK